MLKVFNSGWEYLLTRKSLPLFPNICYNGIVLKKKNHFLVRNWFLLLSFYVVFALFLSSLLHASSSCQITLQWATTQAFKNNPQILLLQKDIEKGKIEVKKASIFFQNNPDLSMSVANRFKQSGNNVIDYGISLGLPIEIRGQRGLSEEIAELNLYRRILELEYVKRKITYAAGNLLIKAVFLKKEINLLEEIIRIEQELMKSLAVKEKTGTISEVKLNTFNLEYLATGEKLLSLKEKLMGVRSELEKIMNKTLPADCDFSFDYQKLEVPEYNKAITTTSERPYVKMACLSKKVAQLKLSLTKRNSLFPRIVPELTFSRDDMDYLIGAGISIPLPFLGTNSKEVESSKIEVAKQELNLMLKKEQIIRELKGKYELLSSIQKRKILYEKSVLSITKENLEEMKIRYDRGEINLITLEKYWDNFLTAKLSYYDLLGRYYTTILDIYYLSGEKFFRQGEK